MSRRSIMSEIRLPGHEETISPVTILDGEGRLIRVVPGNEFRRGPIVRRRIASGEAGEQPGLGGPSAATENHSGTEPLLKG